MKIKLLHTLKNYDRKNLIKDIIAGIIIMAVSIPISMGYAQIAGLPAVYGIYGSVFPILAFALFSTSSQFIFGVRFRRGNCSSSGNDIFCGRMVACILFYEDRKTCKLYFSACNGWIYNRNMYNDYINADS